MFGYEKTYCGTIGRAVISKINILNLSFLYKINIDTIIAVGISIIYLETFLSKS